MAATQFADIFDVTIYSALPPVNSPEKTAFFESGVVMRNALLDQLANSPGKDAVLPFWKDIDLSSAPNQSSDNPADIAVPDKVTQGAQRAYKFALSKGWATSDLASDIAMGARAMEHIKGRTSNYWTHWWQNYLQATALGVMANNIAAAGGVVNNSDMVRSVASESIAGQSSATKFNADAFTDAVYTMGDSASDLKAICVHPMVMAQMVKANDIDFIPSADGKIMIKTYKGMRVIDSEAMPVLAGATDGFKYVSVIFGEGAFGYGVGNPSKPVAVDRNEAAGNGSGIETLWERKHWYLHPFGYAAVTEPAGQAHTLGYTIAELQTATTWQRVVPRKTIPMAFLITN